MFSCFLLFSLCLYFAYDYFPIKIPRKREYVIKNLYKAFGLAFMCVLALPTVILPAVQGVWKTELIHIIAAAYVSHDFVGLIRVPLPRNTQLHHIASVVLMLVAFQLDFATSSLGQAIFVYTVCSAMSFVVNFYLAVRFWSPIPWLRSLAFWVYAICCTVNWTWHLLMYRFEWDVWHGSYMVALIFIVYDDIHLLKWLWRNEMK
jgi:hypothetical protein